MTTTDLIARLRAKRAVAAIHPEEPGRLTVLDTPDPDCAEAADRLESLTTPAADLGLETTAEERAGSLSRMEKRHSGGFMYRLLRDHDRLIATARAERERADAAEAKYDNLLTTWTESRERHLKAEAEVARLKAALASLIEDADDNGTAFNAENVRLIVGVHTLRLARAALADQPTEEPK